MKKTLALLLACLSLSLGFAQSGALEVQNHGSLKAVTFNIWSGSDYAGIASFGEWESAATREQRYQILLAELRELDPQVIFLQEVNPVGKYSRRLARDLNMDQIHQVCVAGIKLFGLGIPKGFQEGNAILAKPGLQLEKIEDWKLSGSPGVFSGNFSFHVDDPVSALAGRIVWENKPLNLVCVHLSAYPDVTPALQDSLQALCGRQGWSEADCGKVREKWEKGLKERLKEAKLLLKQIAKLEPDVPLILAGDFNSQPASIVMENILAKGKFIDSADAEPEYATWDALRNSNTFHSQFGHDARGNPNSHWKKFAAIDSAQLRRLDYILLDKAFQPADVLDNRPVFNQPVNGLYASDHYGVLAELDLNAPLASAPELFGRIPRSAKTKISGLPIAMYDTDTGFGYGAKGFLFNLFKANESYDITLFNSTEGERWYKFEFSLPDEELRQRRKYPLALDLRVDYDKWINSKYFPAGYDADSDDPEIFTKEPLDVSLLLTHPFNRYLNGQIGAQFSHVSLYNFAEAPVLQQYLQGKDTETAYLSNIINLRWDTLNSAKNPSRGFYLKHELETNWLHGQLRGDPENERGDPLSFSWGRKFNFLRNTTTARYYTVLWYPKTVLALRLQGKCQTGEDIPFQFKLPLGGGTSLRGTSSGRYLDDTVVVANAELRFPIYKGLGGILGYDAGAAAYSPEQLALQDLVSNPVAGLRYYMSDFIVRLDVGFGEEGMGLYFNFGHAF